MVFPAFTLPPPSYRANGKYQRPHGIDRMFPLRADQTYDGRTYANPDEMLKIAEISLRINRHSRDGFPARIALLTGLGNGGSPLPRAKGDRGLRLTYSDAETRSISLSIGIPLPLMYLLQAAGAGHTDAGGARNRAISDTMSANICRDTAT